jgi:hypothetical protein
VQMDKVISQKDLSKLKLLVVQKESQRKIDLATAKNIFGNFQVDNSLLTEGKIPVTFYSFDKRKEVYNEYAICLGNTNLGNGSCTLYFFKGNKIISKHEINYRYILEFESYKDEDGKTIIYYKHNFGTGTGIWQFNYFFYKLYDDKLVPILNELHDANLNGYGGHNLTFNSNIIKVSPLTLKMVFEHELYDADENISKIVDDSIIVTYSWDIKSRTLVGNFDKRKINKFQKLTYYPGSSELLFINSYYSLLKNCVKDKNNRDIVLNYMDIVKFKQMNVNRQHKPQ